MLRSIAFPLALLAFAGTLGCLYVPPLTHATGRGTVLALKAGEETRQSLREKLGAPTVLNLPAVQVWEWRQDRGTLILVGPGNVGGARFKGEIFRVLARFEGDRAVALETEMEPDTEHPAQEPPFPDPADRVLLGDSPPPSRPSSSKAWVATGGRVFALAPVGDLWIRDPGQSQARRVAELEALPGNRVFPWQGYQGSVSSDGRFLALGGRETVLVWDAVAGQMAARLSTFATDPPGTKRKFFNVGAAAFSPDGKWLALSGIGSTSSGSFLGSYQLRSHLRLVEVGTWKPAWELEEVPSGDLRFSPDGTRLLVGGTLYEAATGRRIAATPAARAVFYAGGRRYVVLGSDLQIHEADSGKLLGRVPLRTGFISTAQALQGGSLLAVGKGILIRCDLEAIERALPGMKPSEGDALTLAGDAFLQVRLLPLWRHLARSTGEELPSELSLSPGGDYLLERANPFFRDYPKWDSHTQGLRILDTRTLRTLWAEPSFKHDLGDARFTEDGRFLRIIGSEVRFWALPKPTLPAQSPSPTPRDASPAVTDATKHPQSPN